jgi:hypothetical protein
VYPSVSVHVPALVRNVVLCARSCQHVKVINTSNSFTLRTLYCYSVLQFTLLGPFSFSHSAKKQKQN